MPGWQEKFEKLGSDKFTVVGIALDVEGIPPAKRYYDEHGVTFPSLVDPNYATQFGAVPKTFFVNEHGVVQRLDNWENRLDRPLDSVTDDIRAQWTHQDEADVARSTESLARRHRDDERDLAVATELASRYLADGLREEARHVLERTVASYDAHEVATSEEPADKRLLGQAYLQLSRAAQGREEAVQHARLSYFLNPSIGFAKQIARLMSPEKFDGRPNGDFDNRFREATRRRLEKERATWLKSGD